MNKLAPIGLFVYNRKDHTEQTIEALKKNDLAIESDLFIYSDAAKNHPRGYHPHCLCIVQHTGIQDRNFQMEPFIGFCLSYCCCISDI